MLLQAFVAGFKKIGEKLEMHAIQQVKIAQSSECVGFISPRHVCLQALIDGFKKVGAEVEVKGWVCTATMQTKPKLLYCVWTRWVPLIDAFALAGFKEFSQELHVSLAQTGTFVSTHCFLFLYRLCWMDS